MFLGRSIALAAFVLVAAQATTPVQAQVAAPSEVTAFARQTPQMMSRERRAALRRAAWRRSQAPVVQFTRIVAPTVAAPIASIWSRPYMIVGL
jgi:hypothetical protein